MFSRLLILIVLLATACAPSTTQESATPQSRSEATEEAVPEAAAPSPAAEDGPQPEITNEAASEPIATLPPVEDKLQEKFTQIVISDLATRLRVDAAAISVISAETITWPDAALGCPLPGKVYAQGRVPGFWIKLEAESREYSYHTDRRGQVVLCTGQGPDLKELPTIPVQPGEIDDGEPWKPVN